MNIEYFRESLDNLTYAGQKLTPEEKMLIENSLIVLQNENQFHAIFFWGRINGIEKDYFISYGYARDCLRERKFFYSLDCYQWFLVPFIKQPICFEAAILCREKFLGDPSMLISVKMDPKFNIDENQIILSSEPEIVKLKEEDRLAAIVFIITEECAIIPKGALYKLTDHRVVYNPMFRGLTDLQADNFKFYQLYRLPRNDLKSNLVKRSDYNYATDFLDSIDEVIPTKGSFSLNLEQNERIVLIKSCIWTGMTFYHKLNSRKHGFVYFGDGKKNFDLLFMI